jgi:hypothetical protein
MIRPVQTLAPLKVHLPPLMEPQYDVISCLSSNVISPLRAVVAVGEDDIVPIEMLMQGIAGHILTGST